VQRTSYDTKGGIRIHREIAGAQQQLDRLETSRAVLTQLRQPTFGLRPALIGVRSGAKTPTGVVSYGAHDGPRRLLPTEPSEPPDAATASSQPSPCDSLRMAAA
jgi:hypothetical protein